MSGEDDDIAAQLQNFGLSKRLLKNIARSRRDITEAKASIKSLTKSSFAAIGKDAHNVTER